MHFCRVHVRVGQKRSRHETRAVGDTDGRLRAHDPTHRVSMKLSHLLSLFIARSTQSMLRALGDHPLLLAALGWPQSETLHFESC